MFKHLHYKAKQFFFVLIKLSIVTCAFYFIYHKLTSNEKLDFLVFIDFLNKNNVFSVKNVFFLLILTFFNWLFEVVKWQKLVAMVKPVSFSKAIEQSLAGLTASLFTPNRIGEYGAKAIYFPASFRKRIMWVTLLGNMSQMAITVLLGTLGFLVFYSAFKPSIPLYNTTLLLWILGIGLIMTFWFLFNKKIVIKGFTLPKISSLLKKISIVNYTHLLGLSFLRYVCFSTQFYLLLLFFKIDISYLDAISVITTMYLAASMIPIISIFDVVVKGSIAVYLFSFAGAEELIILCCSTLMWLLNFVIPSVFGSYFILNFNLNNAAE